jgi:hypothetical protein
MLSFFIAISHAARKPMHRDIEPVSIERAQTIEKINDNGLSLVPIIRLDAAINNPDEK